MLLLLEYLKERAPCNNCVPNSASIPAVKLSTLIKCVISNGIVLGII